MASPAVHDRDPRDVITPHNFRVAEHLYGLPLASPWRRLVAIALDGLLLAVLIGGGLTALALLSAVFAVGAIRRGRRHGSSITTSGMSAGTLLVVLALAAGVALWDEVTTDTAVEVAKEGDGGTTLDLSPSQAIAFGLGAAQLKACADAACRGGAVDAMTATLRDAKADRDSAREAVGDIVEAMEIPEAERGALSSRMEAAWPDPADEPSGSAPPPPAERKVDSPRRKERVARQLMKDGGFSLLATLRNLVDDLGISAGWAALYFTLFTWLWNGQTPGKRLLGLRVIHLRGRPLTWWDGFERFGGYAAGLATGLIGYLQVFWDSNRQALHDRVSFTAVIRDPDGTALERAQQLRFAESPPSA